MRNARGWAPSPSNRPFDLADPQSDVSFVVSVFEILKCEFYRASGDAKFKPVFKLANPAALNLGSPWLGPKMPPPPQYLTAVVCEFKPAEFKLAGL